MGVRAFWREWGLVSRRTGFIGWKVTLVEEGEEKRFASLKSKWNDPLIS